MELLSNSSQILDATLVLVMGVFVCIGIGRSLKRPDIRTVALYFWHTIFCFAYLSYALNYGADSIAYYQKSLLEDPEFSLGTYAVTYFTSFFSSGLGLSLAGVFLVFNIFGCIGLLAFDASLQAITMGKKLPVRRLATLIVLVPSASFWSSSIGKDSLAFMATGLLLWAVTTPRRRIWLMAFSVAVMLLVRPHVAALMVVAILVSSVVQRRMNYGQRVLLAISALICALILLPLAMDKNTPPRRPIRVTAI